MARLFPKGDRPTNAKRIGRGHWRIYSTTTVAAGGSLWSLDGNDWFNINSSMGTLTFYDVDLWVDNDDSTLGANQIPENVFIGLGGGLYKQQDSYQADLGNKPTAGSNHGSVTPPSL